MGGDTLVCGKGIGPERSAWRPVHWLLVGSVLLVFVALRVLVWRNTALLEDHDSSFLLTTASVFMGLDLGEIVGLDPDASMFYPVLIAIFSIPGWSMEFGARLATLVSGAVLFLAILGIGRQLTTPVAVIAGLTLAALNPEMAKLGISVLTEPSYVATAYVGLLLLWLQLRRPSMLGAAIVGIVFALAFLNRLEGILFLAFVPFVMVVHKLWVKPEQPGTRQLILWCAIFAGCFVLLAGLQVWRVSHEMGTLAFNGRQAWSLLLNSPTVGTDYLEKIYGLYFDPGEVNHRYVKRHFATVAGLVVNDMGFRELLSAYRELLLFNLNDLYSFRLNKLFGHLAIILFAIGLLELYSRGRRFEVFLILAFIGTGLLAPLLHNVVIRHILVIAPIMFLVAGIGVVAVCERILGARRPDSVLPGALATAVTLLAAAGWAYPLRAALNPPDSNREYSKQEMQQTASAIAQFSADRGRSPLRVVTRRAYIVNYAEGLEFLDMPYTDYEGLVRYSDLKQADLLYFNHELPSFPFADEFDGFSDTPHFSLLFAGEDAKGRQFALYAVTPTD